MFYVDLMILIMWVVGERKWYYWWAL